MTAVVSQMADRLFEPRCSLLSGSGASEVVDVCARALRPHQLIVRGRQSKLSTDLYHLPIGPLSFNRQRYGCDVTVAPAAPEEDNFLVSLPVAGAARFSYGSESADIRPRCGAVASADRVFRFDIEGTFDQIIVRLDRRRVEEVCAGLIGSANGRPVQFKLKIGEIPSFWTRFL